MPIAIVMPPGGVAPAVLTAEADDHLLTLLHNLGFAPVLPNVQLAREWLQGLEEPSGWFGTTDEVTAYLDRFDRDADMASQDVAAARKELGISLEALATALGMGGNDNTRSKRIWDIENGRANLSAQATRRLRALLAKAQIGAL